DTGLVLRLAAVTKILGARIAAAVELLRGLEQTFGSNRLMGRTRMQDALDITGADRLRDWRLPLERDLDRLLEIKPRLLVVQLGGAVGTLEKFGPQARDLVADVANRLGLGAPEKSWHNQRDSIVEFANWLA